MDETKKTRRRWKKVSEDILDHFEVNKREPQSAYLEKSISFEERVVWNAQSQERVRADLELDGTKIKRKKKNDKIMKGHKACRVKDNLRVPSAYGKKLFMKKRDFDRIGIHQRRTLPQTHSQAQFGPTFGLNGAQFNHNLGIEMGLTDEMSALLYDLQNRDLDEQDYDLLLQLDEMNNKDARKERRRLGVIDRWQSHGPLEIHQSEYCAICMEEYDCSSRLKTLVCEHTYHSECLQSWVKSYAATCPLCNIEISKMRPKIDGRVSNSRNLLKIFRLPEKENTKILTKVQRSPSFKTTVIVYTVEAWIFCGLLYLFIQYYS